MVYIVNKDGHPLMPTKRYGKVRRLLKEEKAKVVKRCPFTIRLLYETGNHTQPVSLGVDAGSKHVGLSATTEKAVLYQAEVELRTDIVKLLATRRELRRTRRTRKTRHRKPRFDNRRRGNGWLAPSVQNKVSTHLKVVADICELLPITNIVVEIAKFDIQKIKNPSIEGRGYQQSEQSGFWNVREYVLWRDNYTCQCCGAKNVPMEVHHIESRKTGGNAPNDLVTLCKDCHKGGHKGVVKWPDFSRGMRYRDATFMNVVRKYVYEELKKTYPSVSCTYGYITKSTRIENGIEKSHINDAKCISGNPNAKPNDEYFYIKKVRCHNRQIYKQTVNKGGTKKKNQLDYEVFGFRLHDKVLYNNKECFIVGRRTRGCFVLKTLNGEKVGEVSYKKLSLIEKQSNKMTERRTVLPSPPSLRLEVGVPAP